LIERISAIIIKNKKLLLLTGGGLNLFWTPGGRLENGETHHHCMARELKEEISVTLTSMKHYFDYTVRRNISKDLSNEHCYFVTFKGNIKTDFEIEDFYWYSEDDFKKRNNENSIKLTTSAEKLVFKLIEDNHL